MAAVDWQNIGYAGTFVFGILTGVVVTVRLARVLSDFLRSERDKD